MPKPQTPEERDVYEAAKARVNADAVANFHDPEWRRETAAEITQLIQFGFDHENILPYLTTVETAADGDRIFVEEMEGVDVHWVAPGARIQESIETEEVFELKPERVAFHVSELVEKLLSNFFGRQQGIVDGAISALDAGVQSRILALIQAAIPSGNASYVGVNGVDLADINSALTEVRDESLSDVVTIVGRGTMIDQIFDKLVANDNFAPAAQDEIVANGFLGKYRGANLVSLKNYKNASHRSYFPANELYVVGADASTTGLWGSLKTEDYVTDGLNNKKWHFEGLRKAGFALYFPERIRRIVDGSRTA